MFVSSYVDYLCISFYYFLKVIFNTLTFFNFRIRFSISVYDLIKETKMGVYKFIHGNHGNEMFSAMTDLWKDEKYCDCTLVVDNFRIQVKC